jgi:long-subunit acyl-CoA synthetase (AMP-forming)
MLSQNPSATNQAVDQDGWFNTGDIGWIAPRRATGPSRNCGGMLVLEGRAKDTIVLTTGIVITLSISRKSLKVFMQDMFTIIFVYWSVILDFEVN